VPQILDGNRIRDQIKAECHPRVERLLTRAGRPPGLAVVLVGDNPASQVYVRGKTKTAAELGIYNETITPPADISTDDLCRLIRSLNARPEIDGILVQLPLPEANRRAKSPPRSRPGKRRGRLSPLQRWPARHGPPGLRPCTPAGVIEMLKRYDIPIAGRNAVVVGRSDIVGKPMAMLLLMENATVTICHSRTATSPPCAAPPISWWPPSAAPP
jgi:methylenetetrahydrofolate dehydrogenase (NADP+)/methenyltetrahydrofolate cyclohydrolase